MRNIERRQTRRQNNSADRRNYRDEAVTLRALNQNEILNTLVVARDGIDVPACALGTGKYAATAGRGLQRLWLHLRLQESDGLQFPEQTPADARNSRIPAVISSGEAEDLLKSCDPGANGCVRKPVIFEQPLAATRRSGLYRLLVNPTAPNER